jgi:hypothetical protein
MAWTMENPLSRNVLPDFPHLHHLVKSVDLTPIN